MLPSPAVITGSSTNRIRADCVGYGLSLTVNGYLVAQTQAAEWKEGDVGLLAGTYADPGTEILFDNLTVFQP